MHTGWIILCAFVGAALCIGWGYWLCHKTMRSIADACLHRRDVCKLFGEPWPPKERWDCRATREMTPQAVLRPHPKDRWQQETQRCGTCLVTRVEIEACRTRRDNVLGASLHRLHDMPPPGSLSIVDGLDGGEVSVVEVDTLSHVRVSCKRTESKK